MLTGSAVVTISNIPFLVLGEMWVTIEQCRIDVECVVITRPCLMYGAAVLPVLNVILSQQT